MAKQEKNEQPQRRGQREGMRAFYAPNNFPNYKGINKNLIWLDRSFALFPIQENDVKVVDEINKALDHASNLASTLAKTRGFIAESK